MKLSVVVCALALPFAPSALCAQQPQKIAAGLASPVTALERVQEQMKTMDLKARIEDARDRTTPLPEDRKVAQSGVVRLDQVRVPGSVAGGPLNILGNQAYVSGKVHFPLDGK